MASTYDEKSAELARHFLSDYEPGKAIVCWRCKGSGKSVRLTDAELVEEVPCPDCEGTGMLDSVQQLARAIQEAVEDFFDTHSFALSVEGTRRLLGASSVTPVANVAEAEALFRARHDKD